jgi:hypothetical protein
VKEFIIRRPLFDPVPWSESLAVGAEELDGRAPLDARPDQSDLSDVRSKPEASVLTLLQPQHITQKHLEREQEIASGMVAKRRGKS